MNSLGNGPVSAKLLSSLDRLFATAAIGRKLLSQRQLHDILVELGSDSQGALLQLVNARRLVSEQEFTSFQSMARQLVAMKFPEKHAEELTALAVQDIASDVTDPVVRRFLLLPTDDPTALDETIISTVVVKQANASYALGRLHAKGGLGEVWIARDDQLAREVAVKSIRAEIASRTDARRRFLREARLAGSLQHPNIVPIYQVGETDGELFYAMRFVEGRTLAQAISEFHHGIADRAERRLAAGRLLRAVVDVGEAIAFAHSRGVLHRDLKPANVMLGDFGEVVLIDWGLAKSIRDKEASGPTTDELDDGETAATRQGAVLGSPTYLAPEQAAGDTSSIDERTDLYGLGAILFEVVTGQPPHLPQQGETRDEFIRRIAVHPSLTPRSVKPNAPVRLDAICAKAMAYRPEDRYPAVRNFVDDLNRWLAGESVSALPDNRRVQAKRWAARHPLIVMGTTFGLAAALVAFVAQVAFVQQHHHVAMLRGAERVRSRLQEAVAQTDKERVIVVQLLKYVRDVWSVTLKDQKPVAMEEIDEVVRQFLRTMLISIAYRNANYVDAAYFNAQGSQQAQVALDERISPFMLSKKTGVVPADVHRLIERAGKQPGEVCFGEVQFIDEGRRLCVPAAVAILSEGVNRGILAVNIDIVERIFGAMSLSVRSSPMFLCLFDHHGRSLLTVNELDAVNRRDERSFRHQFPELAERPPEGLNDGEPVFSAKLRKLIAVKRIDLGDDPSDPYLIAVMGQSEESMFEEGDAIQRSWLLAGMAATAVAVLMMVATALLLARLRDAGRQFDGM